MKPASGLPDVATVNSPLAGLGVGAAGFHLTAPIAAEKTSVSEDAAGRSVMKSVDAYASNPQWPCSPSKTGLGAGAAGFSPRTQSG